MPDRLCDIADVCERRRRVRAVRGYANSEVARRITVNCMAGYNQREFVQALKRNPEERLPQGETKYSKRYRYVLISTLGRDSNASAAFSQHALGSFGICCRGELSTCWYILLSGSVFINGSMYLPRSRRASFPTAIRGTGTAQSECP
ncbi:unnamed protein product, partial [Ixodes persulcatus]